MGVEHPAFGSNGNQRKGKLRVIGFTGVATVLCPCSSYPLHVAIIGGQYARVQCPQCENLYRVETIDYHEPKLPKPDEQGRIDPSKIQPVRCHIDFDAETPRVVIARPTVKL